MPNYKDMIGKPTNPVTDKELKSMSVVEGMFTDESVVLVHAGSKLGKTWWALKLASCIACGKPFFGRDVADIDKILYINGELSTRMLARRFHILAEKEGTSVECVEEVVDIISTREIPNFNLHECLAEIGKDYGLVIIDPAYVIYPEDTFDENSNRDVVKMLTKVGSFAQTNKVPVVIIHHNRKGNENAQHFDAASGAGAYGRYASTLITLTTKVMRVVCRDFPSFTESVVLSGGIHWDIREKGKKYDESLDLEQMLNRIEGGFTKRDFSRKYNVDNDKASELLEEALELGLVVKETVRGGNGRNVDRFSQIAS